MLMSDARIHYLGSLAGSVRPCSCQMLAYIFGGHDKGKWRKEERRNTMNGKYEKRILARNSKQIRKEHN